MISNEPLSTRDIPTDALCDAMRECFAVDFVATIACISGAVAKELSLMPEEEWHCIIGVFMPAGDQPDLDPMRPGINALLQWLRRQREWGILEGEKP